MNGSLTGDEIEKILEHLAYSNQTDTMSQRLFSIETETIRQKRISNEKIINALKNIASNSPNSSARNEAYKTLTYLGITPLTNWEAIKTGTKIGFFTTYFAFLFLHVFVMGVSSPIFIIILDMILALIGIPFGIMGAIIGKLWLKTPKAVLTGGFLGIGSAILITIISGGLYGFCFIVIGCY